MAGRGAIDRTLPFVFPTAVAVRNLWQGRPPGCHHEGGRSIQGEFASAEDVGFDIKVFVTVVDEKITWKWRLLKKRARSVKEAKELAADFYAKNPTHVPREKK